VTVTNTVTKTAGARQGSGTRTITATGTAVNNGTAVWTWHATSTATTTIAVTDTRVVTSTGTGIQTLTLTTTATDTATGACLGLWRSTTCGQWCLRETQADRKVCQQYLDCYLAHGCGPATCGGPDQICGVNVVRPASGTAPKIIADQVYQCMACPGSAPASSCAGLPDTTPCSDGSACTTNDQCVSGACVPGTPVDCKALDQCHAVGICDPSTGHCSNPPKDDNTPCDDANACTQTDVCLEGVCSGSNPVPCPAPDLCQNPGVCDEHTGACQYTNKDAGTLCRPAAGLCDVAEVCDGTVGRCPDDQFAPPATECRPAADLCDVAEVCDGRGAACPDDQFAPPTTECRPSAGACDVPERCSGTSSACPSDTKLPAGTVCRATAGLCDAPEACDGINPACPNDASVQCPVLDQCHDAVCIPSNGFCANRPKPDGTPCDDTSSSCDRSDPNGGKCVAASQDRAQIQQFLDSRYTANDIRHAFQTISGEPVDCIDYFAQPGAKAMAARGTPITELPPPVTNTAPLTGPFAGFIYNGAPDQDGHPRACPAGSVPITRLTVAGIEALGGLDVFRVLGRKLPPPVCPHRPEPAGYQHVIRQFNTATFPFAIEAVASTLSIFTPTLAYGTSDHSISQLWGASEGCHTAIAPDSCVGSDCVQTLEAGWHVDPGVALRVAKAGSTIDDLLKPHLFTFATPDGYSTGCYDDTPTSNETCAIWMGSNGAQFKAGDILPSGQPGGAQVEMEIRFENGPAGKTGGTTVYGWKLNLIVENQFFEVGYWPADQFTGDMKTKLVTYQVGGEVHGSVPMGSGQSPDKGYGQAAYQRDFFAFGHDGSVGMESFDFLAPYETDSTKYKASVAPAPPPDTMGDYFYFGNASSP